MNRKKVPAAAANPTPEELQAGLEKIHSKDNEKEFFNYNLRIPADTHSRIQRHIKKAGQNMKGFLLVSIEEYLEKNGQ